MDYAWRCPIRAAAGWVRGLRTSLSRRWQTPDYNLLSRGGRRRGGGATAARAAHLGTAAADGQGRALAMLAGGDQEGKAGHRQKRAAHQQNSPAIFGLRSLDARRFSRRQ